MPIGSVIVSLAGKNISPKEKTLLAHPKVGGLVLYRENYDENSPTAKADLINLIQEIRSINPNLLIMVDHEGGKIWRFHKDFNRIPSAKELGDKLSKIRSESESTNSKKQEEEYLEEIADYGFLMARELLECGIDLSLAPVVDLDGGSDVISKLLRGYHNNPKIVEIIAKSFIRGMNEAGMPATLKHYPGHGTAPDTHIVNKSTDPRPWQALKKDLAPFQQLIKSHLKFAVMTGHVIYSAVDPVNPAGFSSKWIGEILRGQQGFEGVVMSDCLSMKGADIGTPDKRIMASQAAGCDFQMCTHQKGADLDALLAALDKIPDNKASEERRQTFANHVNKQINKDAALTARLARAKASLALFMAANASASATATTATNTASAASPANNLAAPISTTTNPQPLIIKGPAVNNLSASSSANTNSTATSKTDSKQVPK